MAIKQSQRIGIWIIIGVLFFGTIGGFAVMILAPQNANADLARANELQSQYQQATTDYQKKLEEFWKEKNVPNYEVFKEYKNSAAAFNKDDVKELTKKDLKQGEGETLTKESTFKAYYIGWNTSGKVFDSSFNEAGGGLRDPFTVSPGQVIQGWTDGVEGMKIGGIRELTIPASLAYGETGSGEDIPANEPLKFIIMTVSDEGEPQAPEMPQELMDYYIKGRF